MRLLPLFLICLSTSAVAGQTRPLRPNEYAGVRTWEVEWRGTTRSSRSGYAIAHWQVSIKNETNRELASVSLQMVDGRNNRPISGSVEVKGFTNLSVPHHGSVLPYNKTSPVPDFAVEVPESALNLPSGANLVLSGVKGYVRPDLHDTAHLYTALYNADTKTQLAILQKDPTLLKVKDSEGMTATLIAFGSCGPEAIRYVLAHGGNAEGRSAEGSSIMHLAVVNSRPGVLDLAKQQGFSVDDKAKSGRTPLIKAVIGGHFWAWKWLLAHGANPNGSDGTMTAAGRAIIEGQAQALADLVKAGAKRNLRTRDGMGWMHIALLNEAMIDTVASYGVSIDDRNPKTGATPLMLAAQGNTPNVIITLLQHGANPKLKDRQGLDSFAYAKWGGTNYPYLVRTYSRR